MKDNLLTKKENIGLGTGMLKRRNLVEKIADFEEELKLKIAKDYIEMVVRNIKYRG